MKIINQFRGLIFIAIIPPVLLHCNSANAKIPTKQISARINDMLETAILYCYHTEDPDRLHMPWDCTLDSHNIKEWDSTLTQKLKHIGIQLNSPTETNISNSKLPKHFCSLYISQMKWLNSHRVKLSVSLDADYEPPIITEVYGTLYLNYKRNKWVVDNSASSFVTGD